jgi:SAM-dependent methyltransferase
VKDWRRNFFRSAVFTPSQPEAVAKAAGEAAFAWRALGLKKGSSVLDLCCGTGRHSVPLARRGARVLGLDATPEYLARARARGNKNPRYVLGDMRNVPFSDAFDAALNLWTSFGYFDKPSDDLKTLRAVRRALKPGGLFLIDVMNAAWLRRHFEPKRWQRRGDGSYWLEESRLVEGRDPKILSEWTILKRGAPPARAALRVRQYDWARLSGLLRKAGLRPLKRWGGLDGRPLDGDADRLVVLARRPAL